MVNLEIYCVTNKAVNFLNKTGYKLVAVGKGNFPSNYIKCNKKKNIFHKEKYYSELTFHYWFWKNELKKRKKNTWIGFCQKRRFWLQSKKKNKKLLKKIPNEWKKFDSIICEKFYLGKPKYSKLFKRGWRNIMRSPRILNSKKKYNIELHFDLFHGYKNLDRAIDLMHLKDREEFRNYVKSKTFFNPHIMCISKPSILNLWFKDLFSWLSKCEKIFGFSKLKGYDTTRLYAYLAERYHSFWFKKYTKYKEWPYIFIDI